MIAYSGNPLEFPAENALLSGSAAVLAALRESAPPRSAPRSQTVSNSPPPVVGPTSVPVVPVGAPNSLSPSVARLRRDVAAARDARTGGSVEARGVPSQGESRRRQPLTRAATYQGSPSTNTATTRPVRESPESVVPQFLVDYVARRRQDTALTEMAASGAVPVRRGVTGSESDAPLPRLDQLQQRRAARRGERIPQSLDRQPGSRQPRDSPAVEEPLARFSPFARAMIQGRSSTMQALRAATDPMPPRRLRPVGSLPPLARASSVSPVWRENRSPSPTRGTSFAAPVDNEPRDLMSDLQTVQDILHSYNPHLLDAYGDAVEELVIRESFDMEQPSAPPEPPIAPSSSAIDSRLIDRFMTAQRAAPDVIKVPPQYLCPITCEIMRDPVMAADGHSYDRHAIVHWLTSHHNSPMTGATLTSRDVVPNFVLRSLIVELIERTVTERKL